MKEREWFPWQMIICVLDEGRIPMVLGKAYTSVCAWPLQKLPLELLASTAKSTSLSHNAANMYINRTDDQDKQQY